MESKVSQLTGALALAGKETPKRSAIFGSPRRIAQRLPPQTILNDESEVGRIDASVRARIDAFHNASKQIDRTELRPEAVVAREKKLRSDFAESIRETGVRLGEIKRGLEGQLEHYSGPAIRARQEFDADPVKDATIGSYWIARLERADRTELLEVARLAASSVRPALAYAVEREVGRRDFSTDDKAEVLQLCASCPIPGRDSEAATSLERALVTIELLLVESRELETGASGGSAEKRLEIGLRFPGASRISDSRSAA